MDHVLQLTVLKHTLVMQAQLRASGNKEEENVMLLLKKAHDLVAFINSSPMSKKKLDNAQRQGYPGKSVLSLIQDVKTCWWSMHMLVERIVELKDAILCHLSVCLEAC